MEIAMSEVRYSDPIYTEREEDVSIAVPSCMERGALDDPTWGKPFARLSLPASSVISCSNGNDSEVDRY
jgi:hypothetical protein